MPKWFKSNSTALRPEHIFPICTDAFPPESIVGYEYDYAEEDIAKDSDFITAGFIFDFIADIPIPTSAKSCPLKSAPAIEREDPDAKLYLEKDAFAVNMATNTCCGYTATVFVFYLCMFIMYLQANDCERFSDAYKRGLIAPFIRAIKKETPDNIPIKLPDIFLPMFEGNPIIEVNGEALDEHSSDFYKMVSPYCRTKDPATKKRVHASSQFMTCVSGYSAIRPGINLVTFYSHVGKCVSSHHFFVYCIGKYVTVADTWLGGCYGSRGTWRRIFRTPNFTALLRTMATDIAPEYRTELMKQYFYAPAFVPDRIPGCTEALMRREDYDIPYVEAKPLFVYSINNFDTYRATSKGGTRYNDNLFTRLVRYAFFKNPRIREALHGPNSDETSRIASRSGPGALGKKTRRKKGKNKKKKKKSRRKA